jgi:hypothetical protein
MLYDQSIIFYVSLAILAASVLLVIEYRHLKRAVRIFAFFIVSSLLLLNSNNLVGQVIGLIIFFILPFVLSASSEKDV